MRYYFGIEKNDPMTIIAFETLHNLKIWVERGEKREKVSRAKVLKGLANLKRDGHLPVAGNVYLVSTIEKTETERREYAEEIMPDCRVDGASKTPVAIRN